MSTLEKQSLDFSRENAKTSNAAVAILIMWMMDGLVCPEEDVSTTLSRFILLRDAMPVGMAQFLKNTRVRTENGFATESDSGKDLKAAV